MTATDTVRSLITNNGAHAIYGVLNNSGEGFDPTDDIDGWELYSAAENTSDLAIYIDGDDVIFGRH